MTASQLLNLIILLVLVITGIKRKYYKGFAAPFWYWFIHALVFYLTVVINDFVAIPVSFHTWSAILRNHLLITALQHIFVAEKR